MSQNIDYVDYVNSVVSVDRMFGTLLPNAPAFLDLVGFSSISATNQEHQWYDHSFNVFNSDITAFDTDGDGTGVTVTSTKGLLAGDVLRVEGANGASKTEQMLVASVDSATEITVTRDYGSTTGVTLIVGDVLKLVSRPTTEGTTFVQGGTEQASKVTNFTQIFKEAVALSGSKLSTDTYDNSTTMFFQEKWKLEGLLQQLNNAMIHGIKIDGSSTGKYAMGGILEYLQGGNVTAVGGALTSTVINDALEDIFDAGGMSNRYALMVAPNQARKISAFNTSGTNPVTQLAQSETNTGSYVTTFTGDLPVMGGQRLQVVVEPNFLKDQAAIIDLDRVSLHPLRNRSFTSRPVNADADGMTREILGEYTMQMKNADEAHGLLTGLTV